MIVAQKCAHGAQVCAAILGNDIAALADELASRGADQVLETVPVGAVSGDDRVNDGSVYLLALGPVTGPLSDTVSQYTIHWGNEGENRVVLDPYDTFSVPPHLMRSVENTGTEVGMVMVIYGDHPDPNAGIVVPQSVIDADEAAGRQI